MGAPTNVILEASAFVLVLTTVTMVLVTFAMTALALGLGALYPNYGLSGWRG